MLSRLDYLALGLELKGFFNTRPAFLKNELSLDSFFWVAAFVLSSSSFGATGAAGLDEGRALVKTVTGTPSGDWLRRCTGVAVGEAGGGFGAERLEGRVDTPRDRCLVIPASDGEGLGESVVAKGVTIGSSTGVLAAGGGNEVSGSEFSIFVVAGTGFELT